MRNNENRFPLKTDQIRGRIYNINLTPMYLRQKEHKLHFHLMPNQSLINCLNVV